MKFPDTYVAHFLTITDCHQFADLKPMLVLPSYVVMEDDGCLLFMDGQPHSVDGYVHASGGRHLPLAVECHDRLHAMHAEGGEVALQMWCMSTSSPHCNSVVRTEVCDICQFRRGRHE